MSQSSFRLRAGFIERFAGAHRNVDRRACVAALACLLATIGADAAGADESDAPKLPRTAAAIEGSSGPPVEHPLVPALKIAQSSLQSMEAVQDYQATFAKREVVNGTLQTQTMLIKLREKPFGVYLKFATPAEGREVLFVEGQNKKQLLVHEATGIKSLVGTVSLTTNSTTAMAENRYPITEIGMRNFLELTIRQWEKEVNYGETDVRYFPNAKVGGRACQAIESSHPRPRRQFLFHRSRLYIDKETNLPVRIENFGFPRVAGAEPPLLEEYTYTDIRTNLGLTEVDFSSRNPAYNF